MIPDYIINIFVLVSTILFGYWTLFYFKHRRRSNWFFISAIFCGLLVGAGMWYNSDLKYKSNASLQTSQSITKAQYDTAKRSKSIDTSRYNVISNPQKTEQKKSASINNDFVQQKSEHYDVRAYDHGIAIGKLQNMNISSSPSRHIPPDKVRWFVEKLSVFKGTYIVLCSEISDVDSRIFGRELKSLFEAAGWNVKASDSQWDSPAIGIRFISRIKPDTIAEHVCETFWELGIKAQITIIPRHEGPLELRIGIREP